MPSTEKKVKFSSFESYRLYIREDPCIRLIQVGESESDERPQAQSTSASNPGKAVSSTHLNRSSSPQAQNSPRTSAKPTSKPPSQDPQKDVATLTMEVSATNSSCLSADASPVPHVALGKKIQQSNSDNSTHGDTLNTSSVAEKDTAASQEILCEECRFTSPTLSSASISGKRVQISLEPWFFRNVSTGLRTWVFEFDETDTFEDFTREFSDKICSLEGYDVITVNVTIASRQKQVFLGSSNGIASQNGANVHVQSQNKDFHSVAMQTLQISHREAEKESIPISKNFHHFISHHLPSEDVLISIAIMCGEQRGVYIYELDINNRKYQEAEMHLQNKSEREHLRYALGDYWWSKDRYPRRLLPYSKIAFVHTLLGEPTNALKAARRYEQHKNMLASQNIDIPDVEEADQTIRKARGGAFHILAKLYWYRLCANPSERMPGQLYIEEGTIIPLEDIRQEIISYDEISDELRRRQMKIILCMNRKVIQELAHVNFRKSLTESDAALSMRLDSAISVFLATGRVPPCCSLCRSLCSQLLPCSLLPLEVYFPEHERDFYMRYLFCPQCHAHIRIIEQKFIQNVWQPLEAKGKIPVDNHDYTFYFVSVYMFKFMMALMNQKGEKTTPEWKVRKALRDILTHAHGWKPPKDLHEKSYFVPKMYCYIQDEATAKSDEARYYHTSVCLHVVCKHIHFILALKDDVSFDEEFELVRGRPMRFHTRQDKSSFDRH